MNFFFIFDMHVTPFFTQSGVIKRRGREERVRAYPSCHSTRYEVCLLGHHKANTERRTRGHTYSQLN